MKSGKDEWLVLIHGGAGDKDSEVSAARLESGMEKALQAAFTAIAAGRDGLTVIVEALAVLEADPYFDAGYGSFPRLDGSVQLDVSLVDGTGKFFALAGIQRFIHPSRLARHYFLQSQASCFRYFDDSVRSEVAAFSEELRSSFGYRERDEQMCAPAAEAFLEDQRKRGKAPEHGTVGCILRTPEGALFSGTSTGGVPFAPYGRIGDTPVIGAGSYADNRIAAISSTGHGELMLFNSCTAFAAAAMQTPPESNEAICKILKKQIRRCEEVRREAEVGLIALSANGNYGAAHNTEIMPLAVGRGEKTLEWKYVSINGMLGV